MADLCRFAKRAAPIALIAELAGVTAAAQSLPGQPPGSLPAEGRIAASVEFPFHDEPLYLEPGTDQRRGAARLGARLPLFATMGPTGKCRKRWLMVGPSAWVCEDRVRLTDWVALEANQRQTFDDGLQYTYHFVSEDGSFGYAELSRAEEGIPESQLEPGFAVGILRTQHKAGGELYGLTSHGLWIPMRDLRPARRSSFRGVKLDVRRKAPAWIVKDFPAVYSAPGRLLRVSKRPKLARFTQFEVLGSETTRGRSYLKFSDAHWLQADDVRVMTRVAPPSHIGAQERWLDVDTKAQILTAYVGADPIFATLVSTGLGDGDSKNATPKGEHRIWVKLLSSDMTNLESTNANRYYAIESVPYVMFFKNGYGIHAAFWHQSYGHRRSHGCINLSPLDAQFLFHWAGPRLPTGWHAALPTAYDPGTRVLVR